MSQIGGLKLTYKNNKILIAGGAGFIGSHLCEKLLEQNFKVTCLDNLHTGNKNNIKKFAKNKNFKFINHDIVKSINIKTDYILNFACPASPVAYQNDPIKTIKTCVIGTTNLLDLSKKNNAVFLQASTSEVYGDPLEHPQNESYWGNVNPIGIRSCYDEGKRCAETLCFDYKRYYNQDIRVIRIFNTYGPYMQINDGRVISNFINQSIRGHNLTVYGKGEQTRSFCYIDDLTEIVLKIVKSKKSINQPINVGNPSEYSIYEIAKNIIKLSDTKSKIVFKKLPSDDPSRRLPDINFAKKTFKWKPAVSLDEGLKKTIDYFQKIK